MKHTIQTPILLISFLFILNASEAMPIVTKNTNNIAAEKSKPLITLLYSDKCYSSRHFDRNVIHTKSIKNLLRLKFNFTKVDANTSDGKKIARQNKVLILPALIMESNDQSISFQCKLSLDTIEIIQQFNSFLTCCNLKEQIELYKSTDNINTKEASQKIAKYYAARDKKNNKDPLKEIYNYTLHLKYFKEFEDAYLEFYKGES